MARSPFLLLCSLLLLISMVSANKQRGGQRGSVGQRGRFDDQDGDSTDRRDGFNHQRSDTNEQGNRNDRRGDSNVRRGDSNDQNNRRSDPNDQRNSEVRRGDSNDRRDSNNRDSNGQNGNSNNQKNSNEHRGRSNFRRHKPIKQNGSPCTMSKSGMHLRTAGSNNLACKQSYKVKGCTKGVCQGQKRAVCQCQNCTVAPPTEPPPVGFCLINGDPHIWAFSGQPFTPVTAPGIEHLLVRPKRPNGSTGRDKWSINLITFSCSQRGIYDHLLTCVDSVIVRVGKKVIELSRWNTMKVNKKNTTIPWYYPDSTNPTITVEAYQAGMKLIMPNEHISVLVTADHYSDIVVYGYLLLTVPLGDYDGYCNVTSSTKPSETVQETCLTGTVEQATAQCAPILDKNGPFEACIAQYPEEAAIFSQNCVYDTCALPASPTPTACTAMENFVDFCMKSNPALVIDWRSAQLCPPSCPTGMQYTQCASTCPNTCADPNSSELCKAAECKGGCVCKTGTLLENGKCIPSSKCGCSDKMGYHTAAETWADISCTQKCRCKSRNAVCSRDQNAQPCPLPL